MTRRRIRRLLPIRCIISSIWGMFTGSPFWISSFLIPCLLISSKYRVTCRTSAACHCRPDVEGCGVCLSLVVLLGCFDGIFSHSKYYRVQDSQPRGCARRLVGSYINNGILDPQAKIAAFRISMPSGKWRIAISSTIDLQNRVNG